MVLFVGEMKQVSLPRTIYPMLLVFWQIRGFDLVLIGMLCRDSLQDIGCGSVPM